MYLGFDRLGGRDPRRAGKSGQGQLDAAPYGVKGLHDKNTLLTLAQDLACRARRLVTHAGQWNVTARSVNGNEGPVRRKFLHRALDFGAELVRGYERDEVERLVERLGRHLGPPPAAPAFAPELLRLDSFLDGDGYGALQLSLAAPAPRPLRRQLETALVQCPALLGPLLAFGLLHGLPAPGATHGGPRGENPTDARHWLAPDKAVLVEEPLVLPVELLERVVGQHDRADLVGDPEQEGVAPADRSRRRGHYVAIVLGLFVDRALLGRDTVTEGGVHNHGDNVVRVLAQKFAHCLVKPFEAGQ